MWNDVGDGWYPRSRREVEADNRRIVTILDCLDRPKARLNPFGDGVLAVARDEAGRCFLVRRQDGELDTFTDLQLAAAGLWP